MNDKVFIVCVEVNSMKMSESLDKLISEIGESRKITHGCYAVKVFGSVSSDAIRTRILGRMGGQTILFVMKTGFEASWAVEASLDSWLKNNL